MGRQNQCSDVFGQSVLPGSFELGCCTGNKTIRHLWSTYTSVILDYSRVNYGSEKLRIIVFNYQLSMNKTGKFLETKL